MCIDGQRVQGHEPPLKAIEPSMRKAIHAELAMIKPHDSIEQEHLAKALAWVDPGAELCRISKPATPPKHLVS
jgi:8-oxo-dGTP diphosphatase